MKKLQDRPDNHVSIGLILTDPALEQVKWIGSAVLELWEGTDTSLETQPGEFNLLLLLLPTFSPESSLWKLFEDCSTYSRPAGQERSRAIRSTLCTGTFWAWPVASWVGTCCTFLALPCWKGGELCWRLRWEGWPFSSREIQIHIHRRNN